MSPGDASSHRGRLMFYTFWEQEARSYLNEFAARQYTDDEECDELTHELYVAIEYFLNLLQDPKFLEGFSPENILSRDQCLLYTDGALEGDNTVKGLGGVLFKPPMKTPWSFGEKLDLTLPNFDSIAPIEMQAIYRALELFGPEMRGRAVLFFVDNTHAIGCLLKRGAAISERSRPNGSEPSPKRSCYGTAWHKEEYSHYAKFLELPEDTRRFMNELCRKVWQLITFYDLLVWFQYVHTDCNIADPPSRQIPLPNPHCTIRARDYLSYRATPADNYQ